MSLFEVKPYDREVYEKELKDFLPQKILDVHTHVYLKEFFPPKPLAPGEVKRTVTWPSLVAADDSIEDLQETYRLMLPGKDVTALMFTSRGAWDKNNAYVAECSRRTGFPALYYSRPEQTPEELEQEIRKGGFLGLKSYLSLSPKYLPEAEIRIFDFFPKAQLKKMEEDGTFAMLPKKEVIKHQGEIAKLEKYLGGVKEMKKLPGALFIVDPRKERNAIAEARKLHIPIVAIVDTNCDPDEVDYVIPGNDDAIRAIRLIASTMANAVTEGRQGEENTEAPAAEAEAPAAAE